MKNFREAAKINGAALVKGGFGALLAWREDGDVGAQTPRSSARPARLCHPTLCTGSPSNELRYVLCGGPVSRYQAVFNLGAVNGGGRLFVCL